MWIGIALGDVTGIGPEVTLKALAADTEPDVRYLIIGDLGCLSRLNERLGLKLPLQPFTNTKQSSTLTTAPRPLKMPATPDGSPSSGGEGWCPSGRTEGGLPIPFSNQNGRFFVFNPLAESLAEGLPHGSPAAAKAAVAWLKEAAQRCLRQELQALVTAPVSKEAIIRAGQPFVGQTEFLSELAGAHRTAMMLLGHDERGRWLRVVLTTTHVPLKQVASNLTQEKIELAIELASEACRDLGLSRKRVAVCGLNPHAGEGGHLGTEESTVITPAIQSMVRHGIDAAGPFAADALFYYVLRGEYDAVVAMYHDQGLVPLKMIGFETGVNWTLGLPFIRTSPDHGTAYDIAGQGKANPSSMRAAISLAKQLARSKNMPKIGGTSYTSP